MEGPIAAWQPPGSRDPRASAGEERIRRARRLMLDEEIHRQLADTFRVLADPTRGKIVHSLLWQELTTTDLAAIVDSSESAVSQHLRILRDMRIVRPRRQGKLVFYTLDDEHIRALFAVSLSHIRDAGGPAQPAAMLPSAIQRSSTIDADLICSQDED